MVNKKTNNKLKNDLGLYYEIILIDKNFIYKTNDYEELKNFIRFKDERYSIFTIIPYSSILVINVKAKASNYLR